MGIVEMALWPVAWFFSFAGMFLFFACLWFSIPIVLILLMFLGEWAKKAMGSHWYDRLWGD